MGELIATRDAFGNALIACGGENKDIVVLDADLAKATMSVRFKEAYPERFFDVGIAEEHAVTFAAGLALGGMIPVVAVYSSFLQRAMDQVIEDVCLQNLHVVFAVDRAGIVGSDGETHQGCFDLSYLSMIPNMTVMAPKNKWELSDMMKFAVGFGAPIALRYPRGEAYDGLAAFRAPIEYGRSEMIYEEKDIAVLAVGSMVKTAEKVYAQLKLEGRFCTLVNARFVKPVDEDMIRKLVHTHKLLVTMEENVESGGFGERVRTFADDNGLPVRILSIAVPDEYVEHGNVDLLKQEIGIDSDSILKRIHEVLGEV